MSLSPTQRTLRELRKQGRLADICERWIMQPGHPGGGFRKDLFGFIDLIVLDPEQGIIGVQSCGQDFASHRRKIMDSEATENVIEWLECGGVCELWGWRKRKLKRGAKAMRWQPRIATFRLSDGELVCNE